MLIINCLFNVCVRLFIFNVRRRTVLRAHTRLEPNKQSENQTNNVNGEHLQGVLRTHIGLIDTSSYAFTTHFMFASVQSLCYTGKVDGVKG